MKNLKILTLFSVLLIVPCLLYYTAQFYLHGNICFHVANLELWTIIVIFVFLSLAQNIFLLFQIEKLNNSIVDIKEQDDQNHFDSIKYMQGTREMILDGFYDIKLNKGENENEE